MFLLTEHPRKGHMLVPAVVSLLANPCLHPSSLGSSLFLLAKFFVRIMCSFAKFRIVLWSELQENILREALGYLVDEFRRADVIGTDEARCRCLLMSTMGLPCVCALAKTVKEGEQ
jgi:hypothetical protein